MARYCLKFFIVGVAVAPLCWFCAKLAPAYSSLFLLVDLLASPTILLMMGDTAGITPTQGAILAGAVVLANGLIYAAAGVLFYWSRTDKPAVKDVPAERPISLKPQDFGPGSRLA
jgi:hypothetical protein